MTSHTNLEARKLFEQLLALELPHGDFAIFGSGPLIIRGWIEPTNDLDVLCRGAAWAAVQRVGHRTSLDEWKGVEIVELFDGVLTFGTEWAIGDPDVDLLIDTAETIDGLPFVRLDHVVAYKQIADRPKDRAHLNIIAQRWGGEAW